MPYEHLIVTRVHLKVSLLLALGEKIPADCDYVWLGYEARGYWLKPAKPIQPKRQPIPSLLEEDLPPREQWMSDETYATYVDQSGYRLIRRVNRELPRDPPTPELTRQDGEWFDPHDWSSD